MKRLLAITAVAALMTLGLSSPAGAADDPAVLQGQATRLYSAYFLREPDRAGLRFWIGRLDGGQSLGAVSQFFSQSPEFDERYGDLDDGEFVDLVYQNVLGRLPDATGRAFWVSQLDSGAYDRGRVMIGFSESPEYVEDTGTTPPRADGFDDGTHTDVAGTWRNVTNGDDCTWQRLSEVSDDPDDVIAEGAASGAGRSIVTVADGDAAFRTEGCGTWVPDVGPLTVWAGDPFESGTYRVGRDVMAGTWASTSDGECSWARLSGFGGEETEVIESGSGDDPQTVEIIGGDVGFTASEGCGTWTMVVDAEVAPEDEAP